jgi:hypothetical protein
VINSNVSDMDVFQQIDRSISWKVVWGVFPVIDASIQRDLSRAVDGTAERSVYEVIDWAIRREVEGGGST